MGEFGGAGGRVSGGIVVRMWMWRDAKIWKGEKRVRCWWDGGRQKEHDGLAAACGTCLLALEGTSDESKSGAKMARATHNRALDCRKSIIKAFFHSPLK